MNASRTCPRPDQLAALLSGQVTHRQEEELAGHLDTCTECRQRLEEMADGRLPDGKGVLERLANMPSAGTDDDVTSATATDVYNQSTVDPAQSPAIPVPADLATRLLNPPENPLAIGRLGPYDVLEQIGEGGMGIVYRARDTHLDREVAVKVLSPKLAANDLSRARFLREAERAAAINHTNVVSVLGIDEHHPPREFATSVPMLIMEYIDGETLSERIDELGRLEVEEMLRVSAQIAAGLEAAHETNAIHRDIKPSNILIDHETGRAIITDFGLARAVDDLSLTQTGMLAGTPAFMSPEQTVGRNLDRRTDLFSLGCVMYAALTGDSPFEAGSTIGCIDRVRKDKPVPISDIRDDVPQPLIRLIDEMLAKAPADRPESARIVHDRLLRMLKKPTASNDSTPTKGWTSGRNLAVTVGSLLLGLLGLFAWSQSNRQQAPTSRGQVGSSSSADQTTASSPIVAIPPLQVEVELQRDGQIVQQFSEIQAAIDAAVDGDLLTINVRNSGSMPPLSVSGRTLRIEATADSHPWVFRGSIPSERDAWIELQDAVLDLQSVSCRWLDSPDDSSSATASADPDLPSAAMFDVRQSRLELQACQLSATGARSLVQLSAAPTLLIHHSDLQTDSGTAIRSQTTSAVTLEFDQSLIRSRVGVASHHQPGGETFELALDRTTWIVGDFWQVYPMSQLALDRTPTRPGVGALQFEVNVSGCIFDVGGGVLRVIEPSDRDRALRGSPIERMRTMYYSSLSGRWSNCLYSDGCRFLIFSQHGEDESGGELPPDSRHEVPLPAWAPTTLAGWQQKWAGPADLSLSTEIVYGHHGESAPVDRSAARSNESRQLQILRPGNTAGRYGADFEQLGPDR